MFHTVYTLEKLDKKIDQNSRIQYKVMGAQSWKNIFSKFFNFPNFFRKTSESDEKMTAVTQNRNFSSTEYCKNN